MIYLSLYLVMGVAVRIVFLVLDKIKSNETSIPLLNGMSIDEFFPERNILLQWIVAIILWPALLLIEVNDAIAMKARLSSKSEPVSEEEVFNITRDDLIQQMSVQEIEDQERIVDPLKAVPEVPFGHLNSAWLKFKENLEPDDLIFTFSADWSMWIYKKEKRGGYVILRGENIGPYLLTSRMVIEDI